MYGIKSTTTGFRPAIMFNHLIKNSDGHSTYDIKLKCGLKYLSVCESKVKATKNNQRFRSMAEIYADTHAQVSGPFI